MFKVSISVEYRPPNAIVSVVVILLCSLCKLPLMLSYYLHLLQSTETA